MKNALFILIIFLNSCAESFKYYDSTKFNEEVSNRTDVKTPEELMKVYYKYPAIEWNPRIKISVKKKKPDKFEITLIREGLEDDSQSGEKIVMVAKLIDNKWFVEEIKRNWKCWEGRGHTDWGIEKCN